MIYVLDTHAVVYQDILKLPVEVVTKDTEITNSGLVPTCW